MTSISTWQISHSINFNLKNFTLRYVLHDKFHMTWTFTWQNSHTNFYMTNFIWDLLLHDKFHTTSTSKWQVLYISFLMTNIRHNKNFYMTKFTHHQDINVYMKNFEHQLLQDKFHTEWTFYTSNFTHQLLRDKFHMTNFCVTNFTLH